MQKTTKAHIDVEKTIAGLTEGCRVRDARITELNASIAQLDGRVAGKELELLAEQGNARQEKYRADEEIKRLALKLELTERDNDARVKLISDLQEEMCKLEQTILYLSRR